MCMGSKPSAPAQVTAPPPAAIPRPLASPYAAEAGTPANLSQLRVSSRNGLRLPGLPAMGPPSSLAGLSDYGSVQVNHPGQPRNNIPSGGMTGAIGNLLLGPVIKPPPKP